jgi:VCBS repeat-containing protein
MSASPDPQSARLDVLIGTWRTEGELLGDDGSTTIGAIEGTDAYEWLGRFFVIHRVDVQMGHDHVEALEIIGPYDGDTGAYSTRAYDNQGGIQTSTATVDDDGVWTFDANGAKATLRVAEDGQSMSAEWVRTEDDGATWRPWMRLRLTRRGGK